MDAEKPPRPDVPPAGDEAALLSSPEASTAPPAASSPPLILGVERRVFLVVVISALGYFIDIFDLLLFSILRVPSLKDLGVPPSKVLSTGVLLLNLQLAGLLIGGVFFGVAGDKYGRVKTLFLSISTYSIANIANGLVGSVGWYAFWRFWAGFGLSGELGTAITREWPSAFPVLSFFSHLTGSPLSYFCFISNLLVYVIILQW
jgi:MFS family permease